MSATQRTVVIAKPDAVRRGLVGEILKRFEQRGYRLIGLKMCRPERGLIELHYDELKHLNFFKEFIDFMISGPIVCMAWEGPDAVRQGRRMIGEGRPFECLPGTIRGDFAIDVGENVVHASDTPDAAEREIGLWFPAEGDICLWDRGTHEGGGAAGGSGSSS